MMFTKDMRVKVFARNTEFQDLIGIVVKDQVKDEQVEILLDGRKTPIYFNSYELIPEKVSPYHTRFIPKGEYGELSKIYEEVEELKDAEEQGNPILELCELADIVGAIDGYVEKYHGMGIDEVIKMMRLNEKAFEQGHRK